MPQPLQTDPTRRPRTSDDSEAFRTKQTPPAPSMPQTMNRAPQDVLPDVPSPGTGTGLGVRTTQNRAEPQPEQVPPDQTPTQAPDEAPAGTGLAPGSDRTVSGQLQNLLGSDSPYIDRARTRARQYANRRGVMNSSIAAGAGEAAAIDAALPIASQDADTASREYLRGREHRVQQFMQERGLSHDEAQREADREHATQTQDRELKVRQIMQERGFTHEEAESALDREHAAALQMQEIESRQYMQEQDLRVQQIMQDKWPGLTTLPSAKLDREHATDLQREDLYVRQIDARLAR